MSTVITLPAADLADSTEIEIEVECPASEAYIQILNGDSGETEITLFVDDYEVDSKEAGDFFCVGDELVLVDNYCQDNEEYILKLV
jgi:hypothetical protein